jgi:hypothetical protein
MAAHLLLVLLAAPVGLFPIVVSHAANAPAPGICFEEDEQILIALQEAHPRPANVGVHRAVIYVWMAMLQDVLQPLGGYAPCGVHTGVHTQDYINADTHLDMDLPEDAEVVQDYVDEKIRMVVMGM